MSRAEPRQTVGTPFDSRKRETSPTDWWQTGQTGTRRTASAFSLCTASRMAGARISVTRLEE